MYARRQRKILICPINTTASRPNNRNHPCVGDVSSLRIATVCPFLSPFFINANIALHFPETVAMRQLNQMFALRKAPFFIRKTDKL